MSERDQESFVGRWARLKRQARTGEAEPAAGEDLREGTIAGDGAESGVAALRPPADDAPECPRPLTREDFADIDFDALDFNSDYRRFMAAGVPDDVRNEALRKLWASDPVLTMHDGLDDYCGDYTDAATVPAGIVKTAYRVGKGFLSDAELAEWDRLGKPPADDEARRVAVAEQDAPAADDAPPLPSHTATAPPATEAAAPPPSPADGEPTSADIAVAAPEDTGSKAT
ncbi:MAG: DUF3306 domain-containing protein [Pseudomonadota bacterium]